MYTHSACALEVHSNLSIEDRKIAVLLGALRVGLFPSQALTDFVLYRYVYMSRIGRPGLLAFPSSSCPCTCTYACAVRGKSYGPSASTRTSLLVVKGRSILKHALRSLLGESETGTL